MSERQQAEILLKIIPERNLHIVIALMRELTEYEDDIECALDEADYLAEHTAERLTHEEVFSGLRRSVHAWKYADFFSERATGIIPSD